MKELNFELDEGVFYRVMQKKLKTALVNLPYFPAPGAIATVEVKRGKRTIEQVECTILSAEHAGLQVSLYAVEFIRGIHSVKSGGAKGLILELGGLSVRDKLTRLLDEQRGKQADLIHEQKRTAISRKLKLLRCK